MGLAVAMLLVPAASARADATVSVKDGHLVYAATPSSVNSVDVLESSDDAWFVVYQTPAPITSGPGCQPPTEDSVVRCAGAGVADVTINLGDGDDRAGAQVSVPATIDAGRGNDQIDVGPTGAPSTVAGGPGSDTLWIIDAAPERPGDPGTAQPGWTVNAPGRAAGQGTVTADVENFHGGYAADTIYGTAGDNQIDGDTGPDVIRAGAGNDTIDTADHFYYSNDAPHSGLPADGYSEWPDRVSCGSGHDIVFALARDRWAPDCEEVVVQDVRSSDDDPDVPTVETYPILVELNGNNRRNHIIADPDTRSVIRARGGADSIRATNGKRDVISCGSGRDRVVADRRDRVGRDCERVTRRVASR